MKHGSSRICKDTATTDLNKFSTRLNEYAMITLRGILICNQHTYASILLLNIKRIFKDTMAKHINEYIGKTLRRDVRILPRETSRTIMQDSLIGIHARDL